MRSATDIPNTTPFGRLWLFVFLYSGVLAAVFQLVLLPYVLPTLNAGHGLVVGWDSITFHQLAVYMVEQIHLHGWSAWQLRPLHQAPAGIASAVYALTVPEPWTLIPLYAALQATAAVCLLRIVQLFVPRWRSAVWALVPFVFYPSAMMWYAQILKDGYAIAGIFLTLYGWLLFVRPETWRSAWREPLRSVLLMIPGVTLMWIVRPYGVQMLQMTGILLTAVATGAAFAAPKHYNFTWRVPIKVLVMGLLVVAAMTPLTREGIAMDVDTPAQDSHVTAQTWTKTGWLPHSIESRFYSLAAVRWTFLQAWLHSGGNVDETVLFTNAPSMVKYAPRAAQIAFLAPFPPDWFAPQKGKSTAGMKKVIGLEMLCAYVALLGAVFAIWHWRRRVETWALLVFCVPCLLIYTYATPNIGALYRYRYGYWMPVIALGIAGIVVAYHTFRSKDQALFALESDRGNPNGGN